MAPWQPPPRRASREGTDAHVHYIYDSRSPATGQAGRAPGTRARIKHAFKETSLGTISNWLVDVESRGASHTTSGPQMCKKRCKKRSAPQAAHGAQQQQQQPKTKTQKSSSWSAPKQPRDAACIEP